MRKKAYKRPSMVAEPTEGPPGRVGNLGHGAREPVATPYGADHLRQVLNLSADVPFQRLCEDAAAAIEELRGNQKPIPWMTDD